MNELAIYIFKNPPPKDVFIDFRERGREGERNIDCVRDIDWLPPEVLAGSGASKGPS